MSASKEAFLTQGTLLDQREVAVLKKGLCIQEILAKSVFAWTERLVKPGVASPHGWAVELK